MPASLDVIIAFDRFRFDTAMLRVLRDDGASIDLEPKAIEVLGFFLRNPRRVVHKAELLDAAWKDVAVTPNALTRIIAQLRRALEDDAREARIIETVPTIGYRFLPEVTNLDDRATGTVAVSIVEPTASTPARRFTPARRALALASVVVFASVATGGWWLLARRGIVEAPRSRPPVQVTSFDAITFWPAISPDGRTLAFASNHRGDVFRIYTRVMDDDFAEDRAVTDGAQDDLQPAWSPDGTRIAFTRHLGGVFVMNADGGAVTQLSRFGSTPTWSHDGRQIAFQSDRLVDTGGRPAQPGSTIWRVPVAGGEPVRVTNEGAPPGGHGAPVWSLDDTRLFFISTRNLPSDIWSVHVDSGVLTQITETTRYPVTSLAVTADGNLLVPWKFDRAESESYGIASIAFDDQGKPLPNGRTAIVDPLPRARQFAITPDGRRLFVTLTNVTAQLIDVPIGRDGRPIAPGAAIRLPPDTIGATHPAIARNGRDLAFSAFNPSGRASVWLMDLQTGASRRIVASSGDDRYPVWLPGLPRLLSVRGLPLNVYLVETDIASGRSREVMTLPQAAGFPDVGPDGDRFVANLGEPLNTAAVGSVRERRLVPWEPYREFSFPRLSPDGRMAAFERREGANWHLYVAELDGPARQLSTVPGQHWPYSWSPDGRHLAMASYRQGVWNIWVVAVQTGVEYPVTVQTDPSKQLWYPAWSPTGDRIIYAEVGPRSNIWSVDLAPPTAESR